MHASLLPLLLAPVALATPLVQRASNDTCFSRTSTVKAWELTSLDVSASYIFTTPAHQNSWGHVSFTLKNPALGTVTKCEGSSSQLNDFFNGDVDYECETPDEVEEVDPRLTKGSQNVELDCEETFEQNKDWAIGEIYSNRQVKCKKVDVSVPVKEISAVA
ncbi:hypothetical protein ACHAQA_006588 [Verticillium albo-atrum]